MFDARAGRPDPLLRATSERREPAVIAIRTCFSYHPFRDDATSLDGKARVAGYHSEVTHFGEFAAQPMGYRSVGDVIQRMVREFGDDAELEVVVRRKPGPRNKTPKPKKLQMRGIQAMTETIEDARRDTKPVGGSTDELDSFAARLNRLFANNYPPGRGPYTSQELIRALSMRGQALSAPYLSQLRKGGRSRPSRRTIELIAEFFGVRSEYFTDPEGSYGRRLEAELGWLELAHNSDVQRLTTMLTDLDADTRERLMADAGI
ncbi:hypothetical protein [Mycolicibacterium frederiksbergense]|uniref:HTH cro/C1-type domain-containing protein n=1 Tax=Mycolicibacterium frederiksbergense TaxID=117567 RepID=A0A6H0S0N5_9MYCO|nr:hypothetical protein [Mycolicibacterium frederiksbergense]QIV79607.1 hypothetical protein EXE63_00745 [Mycolicibacterium frederiksbergense]